MRSKRRPQSAKNQFVNKEKESKQHMVADYYNQISEKQSEEMLKETIEQQKLVSIKIG